MNAWLENAIHAFFLNRCGHSYSSKVFPEICNIGWHGRKIGISKFMRVYHISKAELQCQALVSSRKVTDLQLIDKLSGDVSEVATLNSSSIQSSERFSMMSKVRNALIEKFPLYVSNIDDVFNGNAYSFDLYHAGESDVPQKLIVLWGNNEKGIDQLSGCLGDALVDDEKWFRSINGELLLGSSRNETIQRFRRVIGERLNRGGIEVTLPFRVVRIIDFDRCMICRNDEHIEAIKALREELKLFLLDKGYCTGQNVLVIATTKRNMTDFPPEIVNQGVLGYWSEMSFPQEQRKRDLIEFFLSQYINNHHFHPEVLDWLVNILGEISAEELDFFCKKLVVTPEYKDALEEGQIEGDLRRQKAIIRKVISDPILVTERRKNAISGLKNALSYIELTSFKKKIDGAVHFLESMGHRSGCLTCLIVSGGEGSGRTAFCCHLMEKLTSFDGFSSVSLFDLSRFKINRYCLRALAALDAVHKCSAVNSILVLDDADSLSCPDIQVTFDDVKSVELVSAWKALQQTHCSGKNIVLVLAVRSENLPALLKALSSTHISYKVELGSHVEDVDIDIILDAKGVQGEESRLIKEAIVDRKLSVKVFMRIMHHCVSQNGTVDIDAFQRECELNSQVERPELSMFH